MKRRDFLSGVSVGVLSGTAGCIDIPDNILSDDPSMSNNNNNTVLDEGLYLGSADQIDFRVFDIELEFSTVENSAFMYEGELYSLQEFGTIVASDSLADTVREELTGKEILPDPNLLVSSSEFPLSDVENPSERPSGSIQRGLERGVTVEYIVERDNGNVSSEPEIELQELLDQTPNSGSGFVQFEAEPYECTIPVGVRVIVI